MPTPLLIVDDDPFFGSVVSDFLAERGYAPTHVRTAADAEEWLLEGEPVVALVDVYLEEGDSLGVCRRIRGLSPDTSILLMTGRPEGFALGDDAGVLIDDFFVKSKDLDELGRRVAARVEQASSLRTLRQRERLLALLADVARAIAEITDLGALAGAIGPLVLRFPGVVGVRLEVPGIGASGPTVTLVEIGNLQADGNALDAVELGEAGSGWLTLRMEGTARLDRDVLETLGRMIASAVSAARTFESLRERQVRLEHGYVARQRQLAWMEARLQRLTDARDSMLALLSHDLRTPLAIILGNCQLVQESPGRPELVKRANETIQRQSDRMSKMVEELLDRYRRDAANSSSTEVGDLTEVAREMVANLEGLAVRKRQHVELLVGGPAPVEADFAELREVFANLIENALRHSPEGSTVTVSVKVVDDRVAVFVRDRGPGFGKSSATGGSGLGLGLRASGRIVAAAGGKLELTDHPIGGAVATFDLPLATDIPGGLWVLLVGRDGNRVDRLGESLGRAWNTSVSTEATQAEHRVRRGPPAVVVVDVEEGEDDPGFAFLRFLKGDADLAPIPVIAIVPPLGTAWPERLHRLGAYSVLRRPVEVDTLMEAVRRTMKATVEAMKSVVGRATDSLTGAETVEFLLARLPGVLGDYAAVGQPLPLIIVDPVGLPDVNRTWGWAVGDHLLVWLSGFLRELCAAGEWCARANGGRFILVTRCKTMEAANARAAEIVDAIGKARPRLGVARVPVQVSARAVDAVILASDPESWTTTLRGAEEG